MLLNKIKGLLLACSLVAATGAVAGNIEVGDWVVLQETIMCSTPEPIDHANSIGLEFGMGKALEVLNTAAKAGMCNTLPTGIYEVVQRAIAYENTPGEPGVPSVILGFELCIPLGSEHCLRGFTPVYDDDKHTVSAEIARRYWEEVFGKEPEAEKLSI